MDGWMAMFSFEFPSAQTEPRKNDNMILMLLLVQLWFVKKLSHQIS